MAKKEEPIQQEEHFEIADPEGTDVITWEEALRAKMQQQSAQRAALSTGPKFLGFRGGALQIDKVPVPGNKLTIVILAFCAENAWYKGKFDPTKTQTPACWAVYNDVLEMEPHPTVKNPINPECATCPKFQWGSDPMGGRGKACHQRYRFACISFNQDDTAAIKTAELRFATLPVTSGKAFEDYMSKIEMMYQRPLFGVFTEVSVVPDDKTQFKVVFTEKELVPLEAMAALLERINGAEKDVKYDYVDVEAEAVAPSKKV